MAKPLTCFDKAERYARDVVSGKVLACRYVKLVSESFLSGLKEEKRKSYPYYMDKDAAEKVAKFIELMPHVKGKWARAKEKIKLEPWQCFIITNVFGWKRKSDGFRRYREVYIEVPRKNAKSTLTAAIGNYMFAADGEAGAEIYSGATSQKQAWEVFGPARLMAKNTPELIKAFGITVGAKALAIQSKASKFEPIIGKPGDGASPSMSITDEYHEHPTSEQYDTMVTGMGAREQPLAWVITTAGYDTSSPCYALRSSAVEMLEGTVERSTMFSLIYTVDEGDDWTSVDALRKANPNMGVSVFDEFLVTEQEKAINNPRDQAVFKTKHLNVWVTASSPYLNLELWNRLADPNLKEEDFKGEPCFLGLDLASKLDIAAKLKVFRKDIEGVYHYYVFGKFYIPKERVEEPERRHYFGWTQQGHMIATPGDITDYDYIEADVQDDVEMHSVQEIGADPYNATQLLTHLQGTIGTDKVVEVPQTVAHLSEPMKELQALIVSGRIHHDGNPCLAWQIGNLMAKEDRNQNVFPMKEKQDKKIDGTVALIIAIGCALRNKDTTSIYEKNDLYII